MAGRIEYASTGNILPISSRALHLATDYSKLEHVINWPNLFVHT
jgi:hypothetical protein